MTCHSKPTPAPAIELDAQLAVELSAHEDAAALVRDAQRWRLIEAHLQTQEGYVPGSTVRGTVVVMRWPLGVPGLVRGGAGAVCDAYVMARRLSERLSRIPDQGAAHG